jgi:hypothetical protein
MYFQASASNIGTWRNFLKMPHDIVFPLIEWKRPLFPGKYSKCSILNNGFSPQI